MNSSELLRQFRLQVADTARPYLWSDEELWPIMNDAYSMFVRLTGGVSDISSEITEVGVTAGEPTSEVSKKILRFMHARRADGRELDILNFTDLTRPGPSDYGSVTGRMLSDAPGPLIAMVIGMQRGVVRWLNVPQIDNTVRLHVYRLPLDAITDADQEFTDVDEQHHFHLLKWMKTLAYRKEDSETLDTQAADANELAFRNYCAEVKAEFEREKHKNRSVVYGGL